MEEEDKRGIFLSGMLVGTFVAMLTIIIVLATGDHDNATSVRELKTQSQTCKQIKHLEKDGECFVLCPGESKTWQGMTITLPKED